MGILEKHYPTETLQKCLTAFVFEGTVRHDGEPLTPDPVSAVVAALYRHMQEHQGPVCPNICKKNLGDFSNFHAARDRHYRALRIQGIGTCKNKSKVISKEEEKSLWEKGLLGPQNPKSLLNAVFFLNGKNFALRGGSEHSQLKMSQFKRQNDPLSYLYIANGSKNHPGGIRDYKSNKRL